MMKPLTRTFAAATLAFTIGSSSSYSEDDKLVNAQKTEDKTALELIEKFTKKEEKKPENEIFWNVTEGKKPIAAPPEIIKELKAGNENAYEDYKAQKAEKAAESAPKAQETQTETLEAQ